MCTQDWIQERGVHGQHTSNETENLLHTKQWWQEHWVGLFWDASLRVSRLQLIYCCNGSWKVLQEACGDHLQVNHVSLHVHQEIDESLIGKKCQQLRWYILHQNFTAVPLVTVISIVTRHTATLLHCYIIQTNIRTWHMTCVCVYESMIWKY